MTISDDESKPGEGRALGAAVYIASLADELARLAKRHDLDTLAYILDMARLEADQISKHQGRSERADRHTVD